jgi:hypothetical protein
MYHQELLRVSHLRKKQKNTHKEQEKEKASSRSPQSSTSMENQTSNIQEFANTNVTRATRQATTIVDARTLRPRHSMDSNFNNANSFKIKSEIA